MQWLLIEEGNASSDFFGMCTIVSAIKGTLLVFLGTVDGTNNLWFGQSVLRIVIDSVSSISMINISGTEMVTTLSSSQSLKSKGRLVFCPQMPRQTNSTPHATGSGHLLEFSSLTRDYSTVWMEYSHWSLVVGCRQVKYSDLFENTLWHCGQKYCNVPFQNDWYVCTS